MCHVAHLGPLALRLLTIMASLLQAEVPAAPQQPHGMGTALTRRLPTAIGMTLMWRLARARALGQARAAPQGGDLVRLTAFLLAVLAVRAGP